MDKFIILEEAHNAPCNLIDIPSDTSTYASSEEDLDYVEYNNKYRVNENAKLLTDCDDVKTKTKAGKLISTYQKRVHKWQFYKQNHRRSPRKQLDPRPNLNRGPPRVLYCMLGVPLVFLLLYLPLYSNVQMRYVAHREWAFNTSRNISHYVLPDNDTTLLEPDNVCRDRVFLHIIVCSSLQNFAARQIIRETWGNSSEFNYDMFGKMHAQLGGHYLLPPLARIQYYIKYLQHKRKSINTTTHANNDEILTKNISLTSAGATMDTMFTYYMTTKSTTSLLSNIIIPVRVLFLVGRSRDDSLENEETQIRLQQESLQYNDIIQENFIDTYNNLTIKSVLALKWMTRRCLHQSAFFMKCDDDTFVNVPNLLHYLLGGTMPLYNDTLDLFDMHTVNTLAPNNRLNSTHNYLAGYLFCTSRPVANISSKWYMPAYMYTEDKYPPYLSGAGYVMSNDVVSKLYASALNTTLIYLEDVYLTGMCAQRLHLPRYHQPLFGYSRASKLCQFKGTFTQHEMKDDSLMDAYAFVVNVSNNCAPPERIFRRIHFRKSSHCL